MGSGISTPWWLAETAKDIVAAIKRDSSTFAGLIANSSEMLRRDTAFRESLLRSRAASGRHSDANEKVELEWDVSLDDRMELGVWTFRIRGGSFPDDISSADRLELTTQAHEIRWVLFQGTHIKGLGTVKLPQVQNGPPRSTE
jgi:hypothetical protein